jgi:signal peptide peptidase SppA
MSLKKLNTEENSLSSDSKNYDKKQPTGLICRLFSCPPLKWLTRKKPTVACIRLSGVIGGGGMLKSGLTLESLEESIDKAFSLPGLQAVALIINSPGGSPAQSELIYKRIRQLADEKSVPVLAFAEDAAASGGYWLFCAGDETFAAENSILGSIGVISSGFGFHETMKKIGLERRIYTQGDNKSIGDPFSPEKENDIRIIKSVQKDIHESFKSLVRSRRGDKLKAPEEMLFSGEFWTGTRAVELGLADAIGDMHSVIRERFGAKVKVETVTKEKGWLKRKLGVQKTSLLHGMIDVITQTCEEKTLWARLGL